MQYLALMPPRGMFLPVIHLQVLPPCHPCHICPACGQSPCLPAREALMPCAHSPTSHLPGPNDQDLQCDLPFLYVGLWGSCLWGSPCLSCPPLLTGILMNQIFPGHLPHVQPWVPILSVYTPCRWGRQSFGVANGQMSQPKVRLDQNPEGLECQLRVDLVGSGESEVVAGWRRSISMNGIEAGSSCVEG